MPASIMTISLKIIALLAPSFITLFWAVILFSRNSSTKNPGFYIATLMLTFFTVFTSIIPFYTGNIPLYIGLEPLYFLAVCSVFPLIWLYIRSVTCRLRLRKTDLPHLLPAVIISIFDIVFQFLISPGELYRYGTGEGSLATAEFPATMPYLLNAISKAVVLMQIPTYFYRCVKLIRQHRRNIDNYFSGLNRHYFNWIRLFYTVYPVASLTGVVLILAGNSNLNTTPDPLLTTLFFILSAVFFTIAYIANHQRYIENGEFYKGACPLTSKEHSQVHLPDGLKEKLEQLFNETHPYLQHNLKITDVASSLGTNRTYLSKLIHDSYNTNFSGFVNGYRVQEAAKMLRQENFGNYTTKSIAEMAGFNNYNSFTKAFITATGTTPGKFRQLPGDRPSPRSR
jgi:AraC-like DNA-binding protein